MSVLRVFSHEYNALQVAGQEWEAAEAHYDSVLNQDWSNEDAQERFRAAQDRRTAARERWLELRGS